MLLTEMSHRRKRRKRSFYFKKEEGELKEAVLTCVDDFTLAGDETFLKEIIKGIRTCINVSKVEDNNS